MKPIFIPLIILCIPLLPTSVFSQVQTAGSYLNLSNLNGGPMENGNIIEIRAVISVPSGTTINNLVFTDLIPAGTIYLSNSLRVETNEGIISASLPNTGNYTDLNDADRGNVNYATGKITIFMGDGASSSAGGTVNGSSTIPTVYYSQSIMMAAYQVLVIADPGSTITLGGSFSYKNSNKTVTTNLSPRKINVFSPLQCGSTGPNLITDAVNGTFGSGKNQNGPNYNSNITGFNFTNIGNSQPQDGSYSVVNNSSSNQSSGQVFGVWDIIGDHTGSSNSVGNDPTKSSKNGGYMLAVNASYAPAKVFTTTVNNLNPNSVYTFSFWVYNICPECGADPVTGKQSVPTSPGVKPNLAFQVNDIDYYTTGNIPYTGGWVKGEFSFSSGPATSLSISIINNAPGGGGNDWVIDDISLSKCLSVLPVKLLNFTASPKNRTVILNWTTEDEINNNKFEIERIMDGGDFEKIGTTLADNNRNTQKHFYQFIDQNPLEGTNFYRLKQMDFDGKINYSYVIKATIDKLDTQNFKLYPNPAKKPTVNLSFGSNYQYLTVRIINTSGQLQFLKDFSNVKASIQLDIQSLPPGIYYVMATGDNQTLQPIKLMVE